MLVDEIENFLCEGGKNPTEHIQIAESLLERALDQLRWRSVEDELPEEGVLVIVAGGVAFYDKQEGWISQTEANGSDRVIQWVVEYWMPLPESPK